MALCINCKISGSHASGENTKHTLINIDEAYDIGVQEAKVNDEKLEKHKAVIRRKLQLLDEKIAEINNNARAVENDLYEVLERALESLQSQTQNKLNVLLADQMELRRQYEEIQWAESFLKYQIEVLNPHHYLVSWARHLERKNDLVGNRDFEMGDVVSDLRLIGSITVTTDAALKKAEGIKKEDVKDIDDLMTKTMMNQFAKRNNGNYLTPAKMEDPQNSIYQNIKKKDEVNAKIMGLGEGPASSMKKWEAMLKTTNQGKDQFRGAGESNLNIDVTGSFASESHERYDRLKQKYDESYLAQYTSKLFKNSEILSDQQHEGKLLYYSIPLLDQQLYELKLRKNYKEASVKAAEIIKLFNEDPYPSLFLFQVEVEKDIIKKFGGFASEPWSAKSGSFGNDNCFLFSLTEKVKLRPNKNPPDDKFTILWHDQMSLSFGYTDLVLEEDGTWTSDIEFNYVSGMDLSPEERKVFLAGKERFIPDILEIWTLKPIKTNLRR